ncbi:MAG: F0F1 ATP synthase subunit B [Gemmataceae bacterium]|jgi:F-type H+-transporting ATPase subunit b|nr:F0F1 ATP synthase subunit B [Gemmataceae bacterium]
MFHRWILAFAFLAGMAFWATPVSFAAAEPKAEGAAKADDHKHDHEHKPPPFEERAGLTRYDLGIYSFIIFILLLGILGKFAWGPMIKGLDAREASLRQTFADAEKSKADAQTALKEIEARLAKANDEVRAILEEARRDATALKERAKAEAAAEIQAERDRARREIETAREQALQDLYQQSVQLAALLSTKTIKREISSEDHRRLLDEALNDLKSTLSKA